MRGRLQGSVLLLVIIILAVLMVGGAALMYRGTLERASASAQAQYEGVNSCARAAYGVLWTDFLASGSDPYVAMPRMEIPDPSHPGQNITLDLGHFDTPTPDLTQIKVRLDNKATAPVSQGATESTNTFRETLGGDPFRFVAHCTYPSGAEHEVEFVVRLGL